MQPACRIDHLVLACADLAQGERFVRSHFGVDTQPGGKHVIMGTHNRLLALGPRTYLELIAIDPEGIAQRPRWFGMDSTSVRSRMVAGPFLLTWVAACNDIAAAAERHTAAGEIIAASRGALSWRITVPEDGSLVFDGVLPTLIQWDGSAHPSDGLADRGCSLLELGLRHPNAAQIAPLLAALRIDGPLQLRPGPAAVTARLATPRGVVEM